MKKTAKQDFSTAEKTGFVVLASALLLLPLNPFWAVIPLGGFLLFSLAAPFFPEFSYYLPIISRGKKSLRAVSLTFDDGPSPTSTPFLLDLLARYGLRATFFVVGEKAEKHPELIARIIAEGHSLGNHSWKHDPFLMLKTKKRLAKDIHDTQQLLQKWAIQPLVFRPPVGITGPRLAGVLAAEGLLAVNYSCRAYDRGNRDVRNISDKIIKNLQYGDIIMLHDLPPYHNSQAELWRQEVDRLLAALAKNQCTIPLEKLIEHPVQAVLR